VEHVHVSVGRPYVRLFLSARRCCGFAAVGPVNSRYRSIAVRFAARPGLSSSRAAAATCGGRMWAVPRYQLTQEAERRLVRGEMTFFLADVFFWISGHDANQAKMKLFITDGSDVALCGDCLVFTKLKSDTVITVHNIAQVWRHFPYSIDLDRRTCGF